MTFVDAIRHSVVPAVPVPFRGEEIGETELGAYARWMGDHDVRAVALWTHTGRGLLLTGEQREQVFEIWRARSPAQQIICGAGCPAEVSLSANPGRRTDQVIEATLTMATHARDLGADALLAYPPHPLRGLAGLDTRVVEYHRALDSLGLPVVAFYLYEDAGGISYSRECLDAVLDLESVVAIKIATLDSVVTFQDVSAAVRKHGEMAVVTGEDRFLGYSLSLGAQGALIGMAAACTDVVTHLARAWFDRDLATFHRLSKRVDRFGQATFVAPMEGYVQRMIWALVADGVLPAGVHDPWSPELPAYEAQRVAEAVRQLRD